MAHEAVVQFVLGLLALHYPLVREAHGVIVAVRTRYEALLFSPLLLACDPAAVARLAARPLVLQLLQVLPPHFLRDRGSPRHIRHDYNIGVVRHH
jgi:hypothetical protein